jgi:hypothetical protein
VPDMGAVVDVVDGRGDIGRGHGEEFRRIGWGHCAGGAVCAGV